MTIYFKLFMFTDITLLKPIMAARRPIWIRSNWNCSESHILFHSNGLAIWQGFPDIMHIKVINATSRPFFNFIELKCFRAYPSLKPHTPLFYSIVYWYLARFFQKFVKIQNTRYLFLQTVCTVQSAEQIANNSYKYKYLMSTHIKSKFNKFSYINMRDFFLYVKYASEFDNIWSLINICGCKLIF